VKFDFTSLPFLTTLVTLDYAEFGGSDNFEVNGAGLFQVSSLQNVPATVAPNVMAAVFGSQILLIGPVESLLIGGQELAIDNIHAVPEPMTSLLLLAGAIVGIRRRRCQASLN
jgi:hypothetical protein